MLKFGKHSIWDQGWPEPGDHWASGHVGLSLSTSRSQWGIVAVCHSHFMKRHETLIRTHLHSHSYFFFLFYYTHRVKLYFCLCTSLYFVFHVLCIVWGYLVADAGVGDPACLSVSLLFFILVLSATFLFLFLWFLLSFANLTFTPCLLHHNIHTDNNINNKIK